MTLSTFDLFKIGIGPSSSHTVGPMLAASRFALQLESLGVIDRTARVSVELYGSLALTGRGHGTDGAVLLGLSGERPESVNVDDAPKLIHAMRTEASVKLLGRWRVPFEEPKDLVFLSDQFLPRHPNAVRFTALAAGGEVLLSEVFYSLGGGFIVSENEADRGEIGIGAIPKPIPYPFKTGADLLARVRESGLSIAALVRANELIVLSGEEVDARLDAIWSVMDASIERGCRCDGTLPGGLGVRRRAPALFQSLTKRGSHDDQQGTASPAIPTEDPLIQMDWVSLFALAVNEENAAGGRIVTAPTNGAAGVIPAVIAYYRRFMPGADAEGVRTFLLTAAAIGMLYKWNASLSAAEMGCQGEVGVACSMAAAGLAAVMGGTAAQIENGAEIGMEHNLGLTCDPVKGLVQIPCIERNTMGAIKAINAARLAVLYGDGSHHVSLDRVIETMRQTGLDMREKYKETSLGGLAVNVVDC